MRMNEQQTEDCVVVQWKRKEIMFAITSATSIGLGWVQYCGGSSYKRTKRPLRALRPEASKHFSRQLYKICIASFHPKWWTSSFRGPPKYIPLGASKGQNPPLIQ